MWGIVFRRKILAAISNQITIQLARINLKTEEKDMTGNFPILFPGWLLQAIVSNDNEANS